jgi:uncharacterized membrane protein
VLVVLLSSGGLAAQTDALHAEPVETLDATPVDASRPHWLVESCGELHHAFSHFPIGWLVLILLAEIVGARRGRPMISSAFGIALVALSVVPAVATGFARSFSYDDPEELAEITLHRNVMIGASIFCIGALLCRLRRSASARTTRPYLALLAAAAILVLVGGYLGGRVVHGGGRLF